MAMPNDDPRVTRNEQGPTDLHAPGTVAGTTLSTPMEENSADRFTRDRGERKRPITLALQGGGSHGAFTWGVLDRLLEEPSLDIEAISGTSAGAMNGALLAYGLMVGGPD